MARQWFVRVKGRELGPFSSSKLKEFAAAGKIDRVTEIRSDDGQNWVPASKLTGLFATETAPAVQSLITVPPLPVHRSQPVTKPCPYCGESILETAVKCRFCNEFLQTMPAMAPAPQPMPLQAYAPPAPAPVVHVHNTTTVNNQMMRARYSRGLAILLSFLVPGLGQIYKGQPFNGVAWFVLTLCGYAFFVVPGLVLHLLCVLGAASGNPYR